MNPADLPGVRWLAALLAVLAVSCGAHRTYKLPLSVASAPATFHSLAVTARSLGLEAAEFDEAVHVRLDESTWIYFTVQVNEYNLVVEIDESVPDQDREAKFGEAKRRADAIWKRAVGGP